ncbi:hypothetical protein [Flammeovirga sp. SubArs3]|uniref:hypothetical protein n=1 Tax=Flammeovirga sp. SubArs3 TaxID=2995316 RepID=UPI00248B5517|nr:hypothetical protein [Flammeovirga sp. SubArs3]
MKRFATITFGVHSLFEILFGMNNYIKGASASQTAEQIAHQTVALAITFRFMGAALFALGILGLLILFKAGVLSKTAKIVAAGFTVFHTLGSLGSIYSASPNFEIYSEPMALGAIILHGTLAVCFAFIALKVDSNH